MALFKVQCCFKAVRLSPFSVLLRATGISRGLRTKQLSVHVSNKKLVLNILNQKQYSSSRQMPNSTLEVNRLITKGRLILIVLGVIGVGCLVGWEKMTHQSERNKEKIRILHSCVLMARNAVKEGRYEEALEQYRKARIYVEQVNMSSASVQNKVILNIVDQLGHLAYELGNWEEAEVFLRQAERVMLECGIEKDDDRYLEVILRIAYIDSINGRRDDALEQFTFCITTLENKLSVQDIYSDKYSDRLILYGMALTEYGTYTKKIGLFDASEHSFSKALNVCRSVFGPNHEQTSVLANDLATIYDEKGNFNKAIQLAEKAIQIATEAAPQNLAMYKYNLAHILIHKGDMERARNAFHEALILAEVNEDIETKELAESSIMKLEVLVS